MQAFRRLRYERNTEPCTHQSQYRMYLTDILDIAWHDIFRPEQADEQVIKVPPLRGGVHDEGLPVDVLECRVPAGSQRMIGWHGGHERLSQHAHHLHAATIDRQANQAKVDPVER